MVNGGKGFNLKDVEAGMDGFFEGNECSLMFGSVIIVNDVVISCVNFTI
jgi:hypothetical protein